MSDFGRFKKEFQVAVDKSIKASEESIRAAAVNVFTNIIVATPVGNPNNWSSQSLPAPKGYSGGALRGNWQTTLGSPATSTTERKQKSESGSATGETDTGTRGYTIKTSMYLTNNLPYAQRINDGYSVQPGVEMKFVEKNVNKFDNILRQIVSKNKI